MNHGVSVNNKYQEEVISILNKVDFSNQPFLYRFIYTYPKFLVKHYFIGKKYGSIIKQSIIRTIIKM